MGCADLPSFKVAQGERLAEGLRAHGGRCMMLHRLVYNSRWTRGIDSLYY